MKKIILLALTALMVIGCDFKNQDWSYNKSRSISYSTIVIDTTIVIDSCEYIEGYYSLAHKGNCKYCKERRKQELKELVEQLKKK